MRNTTKLLLPLCLLCVVYVVMLTAQQVSLNIQVNDARPLAGACTKLEELSWIPINYEDVPYSYAGDLKDVTNEVLTPDQRANAAPGFRLIGPRGGALSLTVPGEEGSLKIHSLEWAHDAAVAAVNAQSAAYNQEFIVDQWDGVLFVRADQAKDKAGRVQRIVPVLSTLISFPSETRSGYAALQLITGLVSKATNSQVVAGLLPMQPFMATDVQIGAENEPARLVLIRLFHAMAAVRPMPAFSYHLYYDANLKPDYYGMTISAVPGTVPTPAKKGLPPVPTPGPSDPSPFFKKSGNAL